MSDEVVKKFMYLNRKAPYGSIYALEALEVVLIGAAFDQDVSLVFMDDGVYQLKSGQKTAVDSGAGMKEFSKTYRALEGYDVEKLYVHETSMKERGLEVDDLLVDVEVLNDEQLADLMADQDVVLSF